MIFIIRSGRPDPHRPPPAVLDPALHPGTGLVPVPEGGAADPLWTAKQDSVNVPGRIGLPGLRHSIGLARWWHLGADTLWLLNGLVFYILLFTTGHWQRLVPTSWDHVPNAASVALQYLSLDWPHEIGWTAYNALQVFAYFVTVFVAGPAALSPAWDCHRPCPPGSSP